MKDLIIVSGLSAGVGIGVILTGIANGQASIGVLGSTAGAIMGASVVRKLEDDRNRTTLVKLEELKNRELTREESTNLIQQLESLRPTVNQLQKDREREEQNLVALRGKLGNQQAELEFTGRELEQSKNNLEDIRQTVGNLTAQKQELENRISVINQENPRLLELEELRRQIEQSRIEKSALEGKISGLTSQLESLESRRQETVSIELELRAKEIDLEKLTTKVEDLKNQSQELEQRAADLELLRFTYDNIIKQNQDYEEKVNQLRPEIQRLELEKQQILHSIQENQNEYQKVQELRERLHSLRLSIADESSRLREVETETQNLQGKKAALEESNARLQKQREELERAISRYKQEIVEIENSAELALQSLKENLWTDLPKTIRPKKQESEFIADFISGIRSQGLTFSTRTINAFHTSLKVQDISALVILAGISGTGKSELPQRYAKYIGAQLLTLAVQPRWDSPQDLQGFYNYVEKKFKPTNLMRGLYQYTKPEMRDRIVLVLLDEMNLARVEYYFSEFLSKLESRRNHATHLELDVGSLRISENERRLQIPNSFLFVGTMNEDETTQTLSDKVLDRANVLTFGRPQNLKLRQENQGGAVQYQDQDSSYLPYSHFQEWVKLPDPNSEIVRSVKYFLNQANEVMEKMGHPFAHRVYQAITQYVVNYPQMETINSPSFKFALADQFGQKLLPKLRGVMVDEAHEQLEEMSRIIDEINDQPLITAFDKARKGRYGQFTWQGLVYEDEEV
ncbi:MAG: AAA family ATPase [Sphaerospermopsis sp.]|nr:AAA family ATPase [Sphaerospermopsis sp.]